MQTKTKHFLNAFLVAIFTTFVCCAVFIFGGLVKPEELASSEQPKVQNTLTLQSDFSNNKYVIVGGKVYLYNSAETQTTGLTSSDVAISFDANNKLELIFIKDSVSTLSSFAVSEENIASILTAQKTEDQVEITITDKYDEVEITTSHDAEYVLGELALCCESSLTYQNSQFNLESKPTTSFTAAESAVNAKILYLKSGVFDLSGSKIYTGKDGYRAFYQTGGEFTLNGPTITGFGGEDLYGSVLYISNGEFNFEAGIIGSAVAEHATVDECANTGYSIIYADTASLNSNISIWLCGGRIQNNYSDYLLYLYDTNFDVSEIDNYAVCCFMYGTSVEYNTFTSDCLVYVGYGSCLDFDGSELTNTRCSGNWGSVIWAEEGFSSISLINGKIAYCSEINSVVCAGTAILDIYNFLFEQNQCSDDLVFCYFSAYNTNNITINESCFNENFCSNIISYDMNDCSDNSVFIYGCEFISNTCSGNIIHINEETDDSSFIEIYDFLMQGNTAASGIYLGEGSEIEIWIDAGTISGNSFSLDVLYVGGYLLIADLSIFDNEVGTELIYSEFSSSLTFAGGVNIYDNTCSSSAPVICMEGADVIIGDCMTSPENNIEVSDGYHCAIKGSSIILEQNGLYITHDASTYQADIYFDRYHYFQISDYTTLDSDYTIFKNGITSIDDGDAATSYIAYCTNSSALEDAKGRIIVRNYQFYHQHSTAMKTNYLVCEYKSYTASFDGNGGSNGTSITKKYKAALGTLPSSTRTGYTFNGWFTATSGGTKISSTTTMPYSNTTYYAQWTANKIHITLNKDGGSGGTSEFWYYYNTNTFYSNETCTTVLSSIVAPTKNGYSYTQYNGDGTSGGGNPERYIYPDCSFAPDLCTDIYKDATLYIVWTANKIHITLDKGGGTGGTSEFWYIFDTNIFYSNEACTTVLSKPVLPTKTGYTFMNYHGDGTCGGNNGERYAGYAEVDYGFAGDLYYDIYKDATLYSTWSANSYTVTFAPNGGSVSPTSQSVTYNSTYGTLPTPTRTGYTFIGWNNGKNLIDVSSSLVNPEYTTFVSDGKLSFNVKVGTNTINAFKVQRFLNGTYVNQMYSSSSLGFNKCTFTKESSFNRLRLAVNGSTNDSNYIVDISHLTNGTSYTISYKLDSLNSSACTAVVSEIMLEEGSTFTGYQPYYVLSTSTVNIASNHTLTARWRANTYKVTLNNQSATTAGTTEYYYQYNTTKTINGVLCYYYTNSTCTTGLTDGYYITCPTRTGYTFGGYYTSTGGSGTQYVNASGACVNNLYYNNASNITLYAKWTANTYYVAFDANGGSGSMSNQTHTYGSSLALTANAYSRTGHNFSGWSTSSTATSATYSNKQSVSNLTSTNGATVTLYAVWTAINYTITVTRTEVPIKLSNGTTISSFLVGSAYVCSVPHGTVASASLPYTRSKNALTIIGPSGETISNFGTYAVWNIDGVRTYGTIPIKVGSGSLAVSHTVTKSETWEIVSQNITSSSSLKNTTMIENKIATFGLYNVMCENESMQESQYQMAETNIPENEVWLDDKFRKLQEPAETEVDFDGVSFM